MDFPGRLPGHLLPDDLASTGQARAKEQKNLLSNLQKGDEVVTNGGIAGKIVKVADDFVVLEGV